MIQNGAIPEGKMENFDQVYDAKINDINEQLGQTVLFVLIGDVNTGKSSTINELMGCQVADIASQPGETQQIQEYVYREKIIFADTPGLHDIMKDNSKQSLRYYRNADVILFFLNAAGTVLSAPEKAVFDKVKKSNDNIIIVLNKIDAAEDISSLVEYVKRHTGQKYPVIPISSKTGANMDKLRGKILDLLSGKALTFAREMKNKSIAANKWIYSAATAAASIGASPLPGVDIIPITSIQIGMLLKLSALYHEPISKSKAKEIILATLVGNAGRALFRQGIKFFPGFGSLLGAGVAGSVTYALGQAVKHAYENGLEINADSIGHLIRRYRNS